MRWITGSRNSFKSPSFSPFGRASCLRKRHRHQLPHRAQMLTFKSTRMAPIMRLHLHNLHYCRHYLFRNRRPLHSTLQRATRKRRVGQEPTRAPRLTSKTQVIDNYSSIFDDSSDIAILKGIIDSNSIKKEKELAPGLWLGVYQVLGTLLGVIQSANSEIGRASRR